MEKHQTEIVAKKSSRTITKEEQCVYCILFRVLIDLSALFFLGIAIADYFS
jgi:hypothetical protein